MSGIDSPDVLLRMQSDRALVALKVLASCDRCLRFSRFSRSLMSFAQLVCTGRTEIVLCINRPCLWPSLGTCDKQDVDLSRHLDVSNLSACPVSTKTV